MVSPELLHRYPFFAGLTNEHIVTLAMLAQEKTFEEGEHIFREGDALAEFYLVVEGAVAIVQEVPDRAEEQEVSKQLLHELDMKDITISTIGTGDVFGWSGLVEPHQAAAGAKAIMSSRVIAFDCEALRAKFDGDQYFGYLMIQKAAQIIRERLRDMRIESLAFKVNKE